MSSLEGDHPRVTANEIHGKLGDSGDRLKPAIPVFTQEVIDAVAKALHGKKLAKATLTIRTTGINPQELTVNLSNPDGTNNLDVSLEGDWNREEKQNGSPILATWNGRFSRKENPDAKDPIARIGDFIAPEGTIGRGYGGKNMSWAVKLSRELFPNGAQITGFPTEDTATVEKDKTTIYYAKKIEKNQ